MSERFFRSNRPGYPHPVSSELEIVVSEWRSVIAVSLNVGGGVRLIKPAKLYMCTQKYYKHEDGRTAPGVCGNGSIPQSYSGNVVTRIGIHTSCCLSTLGGGRGGGQYCQYDIFLWIRLKRFVTDNLIG